MYASAFFNLLPVSQLKAEFPTRVVVAPNWADWPTDSFALHLFPFGVCSSRGAASSGSKKYNVFLCDVHKVSFSIQYDPNFVVVRFLCMVVQRGLYLVGFRSGQSRLASEGRVSKGMILVLSFEVAADELCV